MARIVRTVQAEAVAERLFGQRLKDVETQIGVWMQKVRELEKKLEKIEPAEIVVKPKLKPKKV